MKHGKGRSPNRYFLRFKERNERERLYQEVNDRYALTSCSYWAVTNFLLGI